MDNIVKILRVVSSLSLFTFIMTTYFGIVGYQKPWTTIKWINLISLILLFISGPIYYLISFINDLKTKTEEEETDKKEKKVKKSKTRIVLDYILPIFVLIVIYIWSKFVAITVPLYGEYIIFNPLSLLGFGLEYVGEPFKNNEFKNVKNNNVMKGGSNTWYIKIISTFIDVLSTAIYMFGLEWVTGMQMLTTLLGRTFSKIIFGYVPTNETLKQKYPDSYLMEFVQYRVAGDSMMSKIAGLFRKYMLIGLDMPVLDMIFDSVDYNNVLPTHPINLFNQNKKLYEQKRQKGETSLIENWKWDTLPYMYHWMKFSSIGYVISIILIIIRIFIK